MAVPATLDYVTQLHQLVDAAGLAVIVSDIDDCITAWTAAAEHLYGWSADEVIGHHISILWPQDKSTAADEARRSIPAGETVGIWTWWARKDGSLFFAEVHTGPIADDNGEQTGTMALVRHCGLEPELAEPAQFDPLTGTLHRSGLKPLLQSLPVSSVISLLFIDLDSLKSVNDKHGRATGDAILESVGARLNAMVRDSDRVIRYGGDEFIVICPGLHDSGAARRLGDRLRASISSPVNSDGKQISVTASIGGQISTVQHGARPSDFLRHANIALREAKVQGRDTTVIAGEGTQENRAT